jgi:hypothetical protein
MRGNSTRKRRYPCRTPVPRSSRNERIVHVLVTGADVIHSFTVPSFGIKIDAVPGRINET